MFDWNLIAGLVVLALVVWVGYSFAPRLRAMMSGAEMFTNGSGNGNMVANALKDAYVNKKPTDGQNDALQAGDKDGAHAAKSPKPAMGAMGAEKFSDYARYNSDESLSPVPMSAAAKPQGCYPREQLNPAELLPKDENSMWAQANPVGSGDIQGKNFLSAGALIGINTIGQSLRNSNLQLRAEPPNPQQPPGPWNIPTIAPDLQRRPLE
jgi:hypothetical protein